MKSSAERILVLDIICFLLLLGRWRVFIYGGDKRKMGGEYIIK
jgi:hypothetical protein